MLILHRESFRDPDAVCDLLAGHIPSAWKGDGREARGREARGERHRLTQAERAENDLLKSILKWTSQLIVSAATIRMVQVRCLELRQPSGLS